jgi:hypothetical protein
LLRPRRLTIPAVGSCAAVAHSFAIAGKTTPKIARGKAAMLTVTFASQGPPTYVSQPWFHIL